MKVISTSPKFNLQQQVSFLGGQGKILFYQPDGQHWLYGVEMPLGTKPEMGRIGAETIVLISERELYTIRGSSHTKF